MATVVAIITSMVVANATQSITTPNAAITQGASSTAGTHIVYIDFSHTVDIRVASADTILIHNGADSGTRAVNVTLIW